ncbi:splicing factor 3a subunit 1 [Brevipalpus obovatus]|uniref:splicing factor 3a subunit 1 n=1 Tax=Brevipalpus obovatus TaxID=246614 RepID=UPI003D9F9D01
MSSETIGIIYPPPELRNIVDKTASFVARNGPEFETRIQQNEQDNPKFNFLKPGDPYHSYYQHKVNEFRDVGNQKGNEISAPPSANSGSSVLASSKGQTQQQKITKQLELFAEQALKSREPPPDFEYSADPPSISGQDLDIVKLTAQFVAIHGRSFLTNLMRREERNYQFDFLRPQHGLFGYFTQLIEQYTKILQPPKTLVSDLLKELETPSKLMEKVRHRLEWTKIQEAEKQREQEEAEKERMQYASIDWHDFVVVETVDYQPGEQGIFPPPTTPEQVGSRVLLQQRIEEQGQEAVEMDVDSDEEEKDKNEDRHKNMPPPIPPLAQLENVVIRKDYNPKAVKEQQAAPAPTPAKTADAWVISPITGEKIPADKLQEHIRYGLLDPRWIEQRERSIQEKMQQDEVYAPGSAIDANLRELAERRSDIFGSVDEETAIGKKIGEKETKKQDKVTWDGYTSSMEAATRAARANISIKDQIQQIHRTKGLLQDDDKEKIGPSLPSSSQSNQQQNQNHPPPQNVSSAPPHMLQQNRPMDNHPMANMSMMNATNYMPRAQPHHHQMLHQQIPNPHLFHKNDQLMMSQHGAFLMPTPQMMLGMYGMTPMPVPTPDMNAGQMPGMEMNSQLDAEEPPNKKAKEDSLIPEDEFIAMHNGPVTFSVKVPEASDKPEWRLHGQTLNLTLPLKDMVSVIKVKIHELTGLPPGKQKLQFGSVFIKDSNSLALCNIGPGSLLQLGIKERGGRKK